MTNKSKTDGFRRGRGRRRLSKSNHTDSNEQDKKSNDIIIRNSQASKKEESTKLRGREQTRNICHEAVPNCNNNLHNAPNLNINSTKTTPTLLRGWRGQRSKRPPTRNNILQRSLSRTRSGSKVTTEFKSTSYDNERQLPLVKVTTKVTKFSLNACGLFPSNHYSSDDFYVEEEEKEILASGENMQPQNTRVESPRVLNDERQRRISTKTCPADNAEDRGDRDGDGVPSPRDTTDILGAREPGEDCAEIYLNVKGDAARCDADDSHCGQGLKSCGPPSPPLTSRSITQADSNADLAQTFMSVSQAPSLSRPRPIEELEEMEKSNFKFSGTEGEKCWVLGAPTTSLYLSQMSN